MQVLLEKDLARQLLGHDSEDVLQVALFVHDHDRYKYSDTVVSNIWLYVLDYATTSALTPSKVG